MNTKIIKSALRTSIYRNIDLLEISNIQIIDGNVNFSLEFKNAQDFNYIKNLIKEMR